MEQKAVLISAVEFLMLCGIIHFKPFLLQMYQYNKYCKIIVKYMQHVLPVCSTYNLF